MIIGEPRITEENGEVCFSAPVRVDTPALDVPDTVWFRFPESYRDYVNTRSDALLASLITTAQLLGEDVVVEGTVSRRLAYGIGQYLLIFHQWYPRKCRMVRVTYGELTGAPGDRAGHAVGGTFSGGVDSFYSVWQHKPGSEAVPGMELTHCLLVNGFNWDVDLDLAGEFRRVVGVYEPLLRRWGIELVTARHNAQTFLEAAQKVSGKPPSLETGVIAPVLALGNLFSKFYLPGGGTYRYEENTPHSWHPLTLTQLSTEETELLFDGGDATRAEKTCVLAEWEETYSTLRVCWRPTVFNEETGLIENCCRCPKCLRTMITLDLAGKLHEYKTFPRPLDRRRMRASHHVSLDEKIFYYDMLRLAKKKGRADMIRDLRYARHKSRLEAFVRGRILRRPVARKR